jgi:hypothetical protein
VQAEMRNTVQDTTGYMPCSTWMKINLQSSAGYRPPGRPAAQCYTSRQLDSIYYTYHVVALYLKQGHRKQGSIRIAHAMPHSLLLMHALRTAGNITCGRRETLSPSVLHALASTWLSGCQKSRNRAASKNIHAAICRMVLKCCYRRCFIKLKRFNISIIVLSYACY